MSGLPTRRFAFEAFLPREKKERAKVLEQLKQETRTIVLYEAPHHLVKTLEELLDALGNRRISLCRELTKRHEEATLTTIEESLLFYKDNEPRGEYVIIVEGRTFEDLEKESQKSWESMTIEEHMAVYEEDGMDRKAAMKQVAKDRGLSKRDVYQALL
jgi:16S rRNA (cytidine1402-2'-O)-methyltransferase